MKIGWVRSNTEVDLFYEGASSATLGTELRLGIIESLVQDGHTVKVYTQLSKSTRQFMNPEARKMYKGGIDYSFLDEVECVFPEQPDGKDDLIILETAATNTMFGASRECKEPFMLDAFEDICDHEGKVLIYQHGSSDLGFYLGSVVDNAPADRSPYHPNNVYYDSGRFFGNKEFGIITHAKNTEAFMEKMNTKRFRYKDLGLPCTYIPLGYSMNIDYVEGQLAAERPYDIVYIGSERGADSYRSKRIRELLELSDFTVQIIGKWQFEGAIDGIDYAGRVGGHGDVRDLYQRGWVTIQCGDREFEKYSMMTTRMVQAPMAGVLVFSDSRIGSVLEDHTNPALVFEDRDDLHYKIDKFLGVSPEQRNECIRNQIDSLRSWREVNSEILGAKFAKIEVPNLKKQPRQIYLDSLQTSIPM